MAKSASVIGGLRQEFDSLWQETLSVLDDPQCPPPGWRPIGTVNPLAVLVRHVAGADLFWVGELAGGVPSGRVRAQEFAEPFPTVAELKETAARARRVVDYVLAGLKDGRLAGLAQTPAAGASSHPLLQTGQPVTRLYCLLHALTHHAHHNGQMLLLRRLWQAAGDGGPR